LSSSSFDLIFVDWKVLFWFNSCWNSIFFDYSTNLSVPNEFEFYYSSYYLYYYLNRAISLSSLNYPIGLVKFAIIVAYVALIRYGDAFSTVFSFFLAVVFKSRFFELSISSLFKGKISDRSFNSRQLGLKKSLKVNFALPAENLASFASS
jgi:hypothetical protein